jgi:hypothetical protein
LEDEPYPDDEPGWPDHPAVNAQTRLPDGPGTAADPRSAAWAVASLPGPRTFREAPPPRTEDRVAVQVYDEEPAIAEEPAVADEPQQPPVAEEPPPPRFEEEPPPEDLEAGVIHSSDWDLDEDPASYSAPI